MEGLGYVFTGIAVISLLVVIVLIGYLIYSYVTGSPTWPNLRADQISKPPPRPSYAQVPEILKPLIDGLDFQSESNCIWALFVPTERRTGAVTEDTMVRLTGKEMREPTPQDHRTFGQFMQHHTNPNVQPMWQRYITLRDTMSQLLTSLQVFRMSGFDNYNLTYYVVGIDSKNNIIGICVGATET